MSGGENPGILFKFPEPSGTKDTRIIALQEFVRAKDTFILWAVSKFRLHAQYLSTGTPEPQYGDVHPPTREQVRNEMLEQLNANPNNASSNNRRSAQGNVQVLEEDVSQMIIIRLKVWEEERRRAREYAEAKLSIFSNLLLCCNEELRIVVRSNTNFTGIQQNLNARELLKLIGDTTAFRWLQSVNRVLKAQEMRKWLTLATQDENTSLEEFKATFNMMWLEVTTRGVILVEQADKDAAQEVYGARPQPEILQIATKQAMTNMFLNALDMNRYGRIVAKWRLTMHLPMAQSQWPKDLEEAVIRLTDEEASEKEYTVNRHVAFQTEEMRKERKPRTRSPSPGGTSQDNYPARRYEKRLDQSPERRYYKRRAYAKPQQYNRGK